MLETINERILCNACGYEAIRRIWIGYDLKKEACPKCYETGTLEIINKPTYEKNRTAYLDMQGIIKK
jgi:hypothetical protein